MIPAPSAEPAPPAAPEERLDAWAFAGFGKWLLALAAVVLVAYYLFDPGIKHPPGILVPEEPQQTLTPGAASWEFSGCRITPLADFYVRALVLRTERYWLDHGAGLSPVDFVLGWGAMSDQSVVDQLSITQGGRWYQWWPKHRAPPIPAAEIVSHSANVHLIPSDAEVKARLLGVRRGNIVMLDGRLVSIEGQGGYRWKSSLSRTDSGGGACELFWVTRASVQQ